MAFDVPVVDPASLARVVHLARPVAGELFRTGHLASVIGARLADGREIVVKVRPAAPRDRHVHRGAAPTLRVRLSLSAAVAGPVRLDDYEART